MGQDISGRRRLAAAAPGLIAVLVVGLFLSGSPSARAAAGAAAPQMAADVAGDNAAGDNAADDNAVLRWNSAAIQAIRDTAPAPPVAARALAIVHTAMYDAWTAYTPLAVGVVSDGVDRRPRSEWTAANEETAISFAAFRALGDVFPTRAADFANVLGSLGYAPEDARVDASTPAGVGTVAADAVLEARHHDGSNQLGDLTPGAGPYADYTGYTPVNTPDEVIDPEHWQPLRLPNGTVQRYAVPQWGLVTPFALRSGSQLRPLAPPEYGSAAHRQEVAELVQLSAALDDRTKVIAEYWSDGPRSEQPPGHWNLFAQWVSRRDHHDLDADVRLFFALDNALLDASIGAWDAKRAYDRQRPITAIHTVLAGSTIPAWGGPYQGTQPIDAITWRPYFRADVITPPFPEYVSGHSTFSAAAATVLAAFTGSDRFGADAVVARGSSLVEPGTTPSTDVTLSWATFSEAADQAGMSRRYGGIHYRSADLAGRALGREAGALAVAKSLAYFVGVRG